MNAFKSAVGAIITFGVLSLVGTIIVITLIVKGCNKVGEKGLKAVAEEVWEGPDSKEK